MPRPFNLSRKTNQIIEKSFSVLTRKGKGITSLIGTGGLHPLSKFTEWAERNKFSGKVSILQEIII